MSKVSLNGQLVDSESATVSAFDNGFLYGAGLFETMRSYNGKIFELNHHLDRLEASAKTLSIYKSYSNHQIADLINELLKTNNLTNARLRLTLTSGALNTDSDADRQSTLLITAAAIEPYPEQLYENGIMVILSDSRQNPRDPSCGHKTLSYYPRMLALKAAHEKNATEAILFTVTNHLAEGSISNIFLVKDSIVQTPLLSTPVLPGICRKLVCKLARDNSIELVEKDLSIDDLLDAEEVFMTNTIMKIMPVTRIEKHTVGTGKVGTITKKLSELYDTHILENYKS